MTGPVNRSVSVGRRPSPVRLGAGLVAGLVAWLGATAPVASIAAQALGPVEVSVGGRLQVDHDTFEGVYSDDGDSASTNYLRRGRIEFVARAFEHWRLDVEIAPLADEASDVLDTAVIAYSGLAPGTRISLGRFKPDFSLEEATSSRWTTAIERSAIWDLAPAAADRSDSWGIELRHHGTLHHASIGAYNKPDGRARTVRLALAPLASGPSVLHVGAAYSRGANGPGDGEIRTRLGVRGVSESDVGNRIRLARGLDGDGNGLGDVGPGFRSDRAWVLELAYAKGPLSFQAESLRRALDGTGGRPGRVARGHYLQLAYTFTGERRPYDIDGARFGGIRPANETLGAWEVFLRHDRLRVTGERGLVAGSDGKTRASLHTVGLNWYASRKIRVSANYLWGRTGASANDADDNDAGDTRGRAFSLRLQVLF